ncbi:hypothetical protein [Nocardioides sp. InS609-2]|uniref:hypothetical protein n=1 Tax=Nocardioides sp. InS609-2 TaxID=2760705 RepID=UPI0020BE8C81|nr:hypothetical protein [Nocardioides sp. InS609-2]
MTDIHTQIDQQASDRGISHEDAQAVHAFAEFLRDPLSRCPICMDPLGPHQPADHPDQVAYARSLFGWVLTDEEVARRVNRATRNHVRRMAERSARRARGDA